MSPERVQSDLRRIDPDIVIERSSRTGNWVLKKWINALIWEHPNPHLIPSRGVFVTRQYRRTLQTQFALPFGLSGKSIDHAKRMMFWKRGVSPKEVADAVDRDDIYNEVSKKNDRKNFRESFQSDYGKQFTKKLKGEPTIQSGISLKN